MDLSKFFATVDTSTLEFPCELRLEFAGKVWSWHGARKLSEAARLFRAITDAFEGKGKAE